MPVVDDASAERLGSAALRLRHSPASSHAEGMRNGDGTAADATPLTGMPGEDDSAVETPAMALIRLRAEAAKMKAAKKVLSKNLRNARRVNARLKSKARKLTDSELLQIVAMRNGMATLTGRSRPDSSSAAASTSGPPQGTAARSEEGSVNAVDAVDHGDDEVRSGSASERGLDLERLADRMEL